VVVNSGATLQLDIGGGRNEVIPNSAAVTVNGLLNFASGGGTETIGSLAGSGTVSSFVAGTYSLVVGGSTSTTFSGVINNGSGVIGLTKSGNGTLTLSGPNSYTGGTIVSAGQLVGTTASLQGAITNNASVAFDQATTGNYSSLMSGSGSLTKLGVGKVMITGSNSYSGGTTITGGTVEVSAGGSAGGSAAGLGTGTVSIASGGQVTYYLSTASSHAIANAFSLSGGTLYSEDGFNNFAGLVTLASGASTISSRYEDTITLSGGLAGSGDVLLTQAGGLGDGPTYVLPSAGSNTGTVRVSGSSNGRITKLQVANVNALQSATLDMAAGDLGTVEFTVAGTNTYSLGGLQGARSLAFGGNSLSVGGNNQSTTYSGTLSGSGLLTKVGNAMLTLSGSNSYTGGTTISSGTLALSGVGSIGTGGLNLGTIGSPGVFDLLGLTAGSYSLPSSASLAGVGTLSGSGKSLAVLGSLAPGNSAGTITVGTGFTLDLSNSGSSVFEITSPAYTAGTYDLVSGDGSVVFGGILNLAFSGGSYADGTNVLQLFANTGGRSGNFSAVNATGLAAGQSATFNPTTGFITVVPEPSTYAMALAGLACGGYSIFRHRKRA
jgi:autotransporter-associated beta strand protein